MLSHRNSRTAGLRGGKTLRRAQQTAPARRFAIGPASTISRSATLQRIHSGAIARIRPPTSTHAEPCPTSSWTTNCATEAVAPIASMVARSSDAVSATGPTYVGPRSGTRCLVPRSRLQALTRCPLTRCLAPRRLAEAPGIRRVAARQLVRPTRDERVTRCLAPRGGNAGGQEGGLRADRQAARFLRPPLIRPFMPPCP